MQIRLLNLGRGEKFVKEVTLRSKVKTISVSRVASVEQRIAIMMLLV
jgi:hypothetical protein